MSKVIAPRGECRKLELREVLARLAKVTEEAAGFLSRYFEAWKSSDHEEMEANLWHGEPHFAKLMEKYHRAREDLRSLARENPEARSLLLQIPKIQRQYSSMQYARPVLGIISIVANEWLAAHPIEEESFVVRVVEYLLDKTPKSVLADAVIILGYVHYGWWILRGKKRIDRDH